MLYADLPRVVARSRDLGAVVQEAGKLARSASPGRYRWRNGRGKYVEVQPVAFHRVTALRPPRPLSGVRVQARPRRRVNLGHRRRHRPRPRHQPRLASGTSRKNGRPHRRKAPGRPFPVRPAVAWSYVPCAATSCKVPRETGQLQIPQQLPLQLPVDLPRRRRTPPLALRGGVSYPPSARHVAQTVEFHPWNSRRFDVERPDEWRIDRDPMPECGMDTVRSVAEVVREVLAELGARGWPKTSGAAGLHIYVRIPPRWGFTDLRRAALAFSEVERRNPSEATTTWWRKDRELNKVFVDYNQNSRDHTIASAYSVRGVTGRRCLLPLPGTSYKPSSQRTAPSLRCLAALPNSATSTVVSTRPSFPWTSCSNGRTGTSASGEGHGVQRAAEPVSVRPGLAPSPRRQAPRSHLGFHAPLLLTDNPTTLPSDLDSYFTMVFPSFLNTPAPKFVEYALAWGSPEYGGKVANNVNGRLDHAPSDGFHVHALKSD